MSAKTYPTPTIVCPNKACGAVLPLSEQHFQLYFDGKLIQCCWCRIEINLWDFALNTMQKDAQLFRERGLAFIGARSVCFSAPLERGGWLHVKLADYGVPETAKILYAVYTPCGGTVTPFEWSSNELLRPRDRSTIALYGVPREGTEGSDSSEVNFSITFADIPREDHSLSNLVHAFQAFLWDDFSSMIIPAFVATEDTLKRVIDTLLHERGLPAAHRITLAARIEILLPLLCELNALPTLPEQVKTPLKRLMKLRNEMSHEGKLTMPLHLNEAAELICAAIFTYRYLKIAHPPA